MCSEKGDDTNYTGSTSQNDVLNRVFNGDRCRKKTATLHLRVAMLKRERSPRVGPYMTT